jgi:hypothetical protein
MFDNTHRQLILESDLSVIVMGKGEEFIIVRLDGTDEYDEITKAEIAAKGYSFCGVLGLKDGQPCASCNSRGDLAVVHLMMLAGMTFAHVVVDRLKDQAKRESASWLERLYSLPDTRTDA